MAEKSKPKKAAAKPAAKPETKPKAKAAASKVKPVENVTCNHTKADGNKCGGRPLKNGFCMRHGGSNQEGAPSPLAAIPELPTPAPVVKPAAAKKAPTAHSKPSTPNPAHQQAEKVPDGTPQLRERLHSQEQQQIANLKRTERIATLSKASASAGEIALFLQGLSRMAPMFYVDVIPSDPQYRTIEQELADYSECAVSLKVAIDGLISHLFRTT